MRFHGEAADRHTNRVASTLNCSRAHRDSITPPALRPVLSLTLNVVLKLIVIA